MISKAAAQRLKQAPWLVQPETQRIFALLDGAFGETRAVGGVVRDTLIERLREAPEVDFATTLLPDEVMKRAREAGIAVYPTGLEHGTVTLKVGSLTAEVTTLREDVETNGRHAKVKFGTDWTRDAERRDFTLNALYVGMSGELFDPIGGIDDCLAGVVRFIGEARRRIAEDRLRVYRFFRFSASHGQEQFDEEGLAAVRAAASDLGGLSAERVGAEMRRMLQLPRIVKTFSAMTEAGVLKLGPTALERLGVYERRAHKPNMMARLALLLATPDGQTFKARWRLSNDEVATATMIGNAARLLIDFHISEAAYRYPAALSDAVDVAATLAGWTEAGKSAVVQHLGGMDVPSFPVNGTDLINSGYRPGPALGAELDRLEKKWIASNFRLDRNALLADVRR